MAFVLDASVTLVWAFADEQHPVAARAAQHLNDGGESAMVPSLWWYEIRNILLVSERRKRNSAENTARFLKSLAKVRIDVSTKWEDETLLDLARQYALTVYDAAYLALALRERLPLATLDKALQVAARSAGIPLLA